MNRAVPRLVAVATLSMAMAACTSSSAEPPAPTASAGLNTGADCPGLAERGRRIVFGQALGTELGGLVLGTGSTGVVLAHMAGGDVCQWLPYGRELADRGYRVLAFDFAGSGSSPGSGVSRAEQVQAAAATLRAEGAGRTVLMGGSMGATSVLAATPTLDPAPAAVIALSPPTAYGDADASAAAPKITVPVFYGAGELEANFPDEARQLYNATPKTTQRQLVLAPSNQHGLFLVDPGTGEAGIRDQVKAFLDRHAPTA
ncbi:S9 family peptidase [Micromonospora sp. HK10]|uniref:alpha/beta hydrolase family protein n=1 Tax=Micromonospora sp. HK10 TaxID=1538294 RepID=UPI000A509B48|nr:alpha/beta hydrolase [Micromonospora sp. HK10]